MRWPANGGVGAVVAVLALAACSGEPAPTRQDPEICDDGIDNDKDGDIDCDDTNCGGLPCQQQGDDDDDTTEPPPDIEFLYDAEACCNFDFSSADCPSKTIGTIAVINRSKKDSAEVDASCTAVGPDVFTAIRWQAPGASTVAFLVNAIVEPETQIELTAIYQCGGGIDQTFTTDCILTAELPDLSDDLEIEVTGTSLE